MKTVKSSFHCFSCETANTANTTANSPAAGNKGTRSSPATCHTVATRSIKPAEGRYVYRPCRKSPGLRAFRSSVRRIGSPNRSVPITRAYSTFAASCAGRSRRAFFHAQINASARIATAQATPSPGMMTPRKENRWARVGSANAREWSGQSKTFT